jgi:predicted RNase H-like nuclease (RuvC/YqgF family)
MSLLSWAAIHLFSKDYTAVISTINTEVWAIKAQMLSLIEELKVVDKRIKDEKQHFKNLQKTRSALDHEIQFYTKVEKTTGRRMDPAPRSGNEQLIKNWLSHRTDGMLSKIYKLQRHLQERSKQNVIDR